MTPLTPAGSSPGALSLDLHDLLGDLEELPQRILDAAVEQIAVAGWRRSTVADVARRAGLARATVYRYFPNKTALTEALVQEELRKYLKSSTAALSNRGSVIERMSDSAAYTVEFLRGHRALRRLLETEPEMILPALTIHAGPLLHMFADYCVDVWKEDLYAGKAAPSADELAHLRRVAELHIRITLSLVLTPESAIELDTAEQARRFAREYLAPLFAAP